MLMEAIYRKKKDGEYVIHEHFLGPRSEGKMTRLSVWNNTVRVAGLVSVRAHASANVCVTDGMSLLCVPHVFLEFLSIFRHYRGWNLVMKPVWLYLVKGKRKTANGKRKPETEGISITCSGTEPNQDSVPGHARRGGCMPCPRRRHATRGCRAAETWGGEVKEINSCLLAP